MQSNLKVSTGTQIMQGKESVYGQIDKSVPWVTVSHHSVEPSDEKK